MVRLVGLTLAAVLVAFQLWYTHAPAHQRDYVPGWVQSGANVAARAIYHVVDAIGDVAGPPMRHGLDETKMRLGLMTRPEVPREGLMAVGADLSGQSFTARRLDEATLLRARLDGTDFTKAFLFRAMLDGASGTGTVFEEAVLETASLRTASLPGARFAGADLTAVSAQGADFSRADFSGATLSRAQLSATRLRGAVLTGARLDRAVLFGADLSGADLRGATGLYQEQLDTACGDAETVLPPSLTVGPCEAQGPTLR